MLLLEGVFGLVLTNEADGLREELGEILAPVVGYWDLLVLKFSGVLEQIGEIRGHVEDVLDAKLFQDVQVCGVLGTAQVEVRQDLHWKRRLGVRQGAPVRVGGTAGVTVDVRLDV